MALGMSLQALCGLIEKLFSQSKTHLLLTCMNSIYHRRLQQIVDAAELGINTLLLTRDSHMGLLMLS